MTHYEALGVAPDATADEIRVAFRRAASEAHPDRAGGDAERMQRVNAAWQTLGDPARRAEYDATGRDDGADRFESEVRDRLVKIFEGTLEQPEVDPLTSAHNTVSMTLAEISAESLRVEARAKKLRRQRNRVKRKAGGENLFTALVDSKLAECAAAIDNLAHGRRVFERVRELLNDYEAQSDRAYWTEPTALLGGFSL